SLVRGSILANLDTGDVDRLTVGCAGSTDTWLRVTRPREPVGPGTSTLSVSVSGGLGGHSGGDIHLGRANAVKVLGRVLRQAREAQSFRLVSLSGGTSRNAIPRDAVALCSVDSAREPALRCALERAAASAHAAHAASDPALSIGIETAAASPAAWSEAATASMLHAVTLVPTGPLALSSRFGGVVETST